MNNGLDLTSLFTAMVTPFRGSNVDYDALQENIVRQAEAGVGGYLFLGSTGEASTISSEERVEIIRLGVANNSSNQIMVGTSSSSTAEAVRLTREAADLGAGFALVSAPAYNKPSQEGIYQHFVEVAREGGLPVVAYNIPSRTGANITPSTLERIAQLENIVGVKEASGDMGQIMDVLHRFKDDDFYVFSGDDSLTLPMSVLGGDGVISVISNILPEEMVHLVGACQSHDYGEALRHHKYLLPMMQASGLAGNPASVKYMAELIGDHSGDCRLPLVGPSIDDQKKLKEVVGNYSLFDQ